MLKKRVLGLITAAAAIGGTLLAPSASWAGTMAYISLKPTAESAQEMCMRDDADHKNAEGAGNLHMTLEFLGKASEINNETRENILQAVEKIAADNATPGGVKGYAFSSTLFNPRKDQEKPYLRPCTVMLFNSDAITTIQKEIHEARPSNIKPDNHEGPWYAHATMEFGQKVKLADGKESFYDDNGKCASSNYDNLRVAADYCNKTYTFESIKVVFGDETFSYSLKK